MSPAARFPQLCRVALYAGLLYASFAHNILWIPDGVFTVRDGFRVGYAGYDSDLVMNRLTLAGVHPLHPLYGYSHAIDRGSAYTSQFGLQGVIQAAVHRQTSGDVEVFAGRAACVFAALIALILAAFFVSLVPRIGPTATTVAVLLTAHSPILLPFATSLYWVAFLLFGPFVAAWLLYPRCNSAVRFAGLAALTTILVGLKCLCGYEYVSTVALGPAAAVVYHHAARGERLRRAVVPSLLLAAAGVAGFAAAVGVHATQLAAVTGQDALELLRGRAVAHSVAGEVQEGAAYACVAPDPRFLPHPIRGHVRCLLNYYWEPAAATPTTWGPASRFVPFGVVVLAWFAAAQWILRRRSEIPPGVVALLPAAAVGFLASLAWHLPALMHTCVHQPYNLVTFVAPFLLLVYALAGWVFQRVAGGWGCLVVWALLGATVAGNVHAGLGRAAGDRAADDRAAAVVASLRDAVPPLTSAIIYPQIRLDRSPLYLESEVWSPLCRVRAGYDTPGVPAHLIQGWWSGGPPAGDAAGRGRLVAAAGGRVIPARVAYHRITLVERMAGGNSSCTGFTAAIAEGDIPPGEPLRLFVVSGPEPYSVAELALPTRP